MINNIIEVIYWIVILGAFIGFVIYSIFRFVRYLWVILKKRLSDSEHDETDTAVFDEKVVRRYSKRLIIIHWLTVVLVVVAWYLGDALHVARDAKNVTLIGYFAHVLMGGAILLVTILRWTFRGMDGAPPMGEALLDWMARGVHFGLYILLMLISATGFMTLLTSSVGDALLAGDASLLPTKYAGTGLAPHAVHDTLVTVMIVVVTMHILGAIKDWIIKKDSLMGRMSTRWKDKGRGI